MKKLPVYTSLLTVATLLALPITTAADPLPVLAPIIITEVQPGTDSSASEEFIEIYNAAPKTAINLASYGWRLEIASSTATNWDTPYRTIPLTGTIAPGQSYIVASTYKQNNQQNTYLPDIAQTWFTAGITPTAGHVRLVYSTNQRQADGACTAVSTVVDEVEWSTASVVAGQPTTPSLDGRSVLLAKTGGVPKMQSIQRFVMPGGQYVDTNNDAVDFASALPTPGNQTVESIAVEPVGAVLSPVGLPHDGCNPTPPDTAPADPDDSSEPSEPPIPPTEQGSDGSGQGSVEEPATGTNNELLPPTITELLPNPASPQTDDADEFIELYNPNDSAFDLSNFILEVGLATKHQYSLPAGTSIPPQSYAVFYAAQTGLSLSNTSSQAVLKDSAGLAVATTEAYASAPDGQAWAYINGAWQWTVTPTPHAANVLTAPPTLQTTSKKTTVPPKKTTAVKAASIAKTTKTTAPKPPKEAKTVKPKTAELTAATPPARNPLPMGVIAIVGSFAVLYGAYEYRHDIANKVHQLRSHRAARRQHRPPVTRR